MATGIEQTVESATKFAGSDGRRRTLLTVTAASFITPMAGTMVGVALPLIGHGLDVGPSTLGWVVSLYYIIFGIAVPFYGRLGDLTDARWLFAAGIGMFSIGSLVCAIAPNYPFLLAGRVVQAIGTAAVVGLGGAIVARAYPPEERGSALGTMAGIGFVGVAAATPLGGFLTQYLGWRSVFALSAVAGLLAPVAFRALPKREPRGGEQLDIMGGTLLGLAVGGALLTMTEASRGMWGTVHIMVVAISSVVAVILLIVRQRLVCAPFLPRELLSNRRYVLLVAIAFLVAAGDLVVLTGVPLALVEVAGASAAEIGLALLPGSLLPILLTPLAGRLIDRIGALAPIIVGIIAMLGGTLLLSAIGGTTFIITSALFALQAAGIAIMGTAIMAPVSLVVPPRVLNTATGLTEMSFYLGAGCGTALVTAVLAAREGSERAINPLHAGGAPAYGDAFLVAMLPLLAGLVLACVLGRSGRLAPGTQSVQGETAEPSTSS